MAISAVVNGITVLPDNTVRLTLGEIDDASPSDSPGQESLIVINPPSPPELLRCLIDLIVWGGSDELLVGDKVIAERIGYTRIRLLEPGETMRPFSRKIPFPKGKK
jgi:hypothetical protein